MDLIASSDNVSLLYHLAMKAKTVRDAQSHTYSEVCYLGVISSLYDSDNVGLEFVCYERARTGAHQGPRTGTLVESAELSGQGEVAFGYFTCTAKSRGCHEGQGAFLHAR